MLTKEYFIFVDCRLTDLVLMLDSSNDVSNNWRDITNLAAKVISEIFNVDYNGVRVAIIAMGSNARLIADFSDSPLGLNYADPGTYIR